MVVRVFLLCAVAAKGQVVVYEGNTYPELLGWEHELGGTPGADRRLLDGWLEVSADLPLTWDGPTGDADYYRHSLGQFVGVPKVFFEWRVVTDAPAKLFDLWALPVGIAAGGSGAAFYQTGITDGRVRFLRDLTLPILFVDIELGVPHFYRLELHASASYALYIDGVLVQNGVPEATYPNESSSFVWGVRRWYVDSITAWDFVRFGIVPIDGSGDYDSDGGLTLTDFYFVQDCLTKDGPGIFGGPEQDAGPGCRFADFDEDADVDLLDFAEFQNLSSGSHP